MEIETPIEPINTTERKYIKHNEEIATYTLTKKNGSKQTVQYKRKKYISPEQIEDMKYMLSIKTKRKYICIKYNISLPTLKKYIG